MDGFRSNEAESSKNNVNKLSRCENCASNPYIHEKMNKCMMDLQATIRDWERNRGAGWVKHTQK